VRSRAERIELLARGQRVHTGGAARAIRGTAVAECPKSYDEHSASTPLYGELRNICDWRCGGIDQREGFGRTKGRKPTLFASGGKFFFFFAAAAGEYERGRSDNCWVNHVLIQSAARRLGSTAGGVIGGDWRCVARRLRATTVRQDRGPRGTGPKRNCSWRWVVVAAKN